MIFSKEARIRKCSSYGLVLGCIERNCIHKSGTKTYLQKYTTTCPLTDEIVEIKTIPMKSEGSNENENCISIWG
jgi:hypothetical protein